MPARGTAPAKARSGWVTEEEEARVVTISGIVIAAQENRFLLALDKGGTRVFVVAHDARIDPDQLAALQGRQARVAVKFRPIDGLIAKEARSIAVIPS